MRFNFNNRMVAPAAVGVASFAAGVGVGYFVANRRRDKQDKAIDNVYEDVLTVTTEVQTDVEYELPPVAEENEKLKARLKDFADLVRTSVEETPPPTKEEIDEIVRKATGKPKPRPEKVNNVFEPPSDPNWNQEEEEAERTEDAPYIIHVDEFFRNDKGYHQGVLTYYAGDNILCDENNVPIYDPNKIIGRFEFGRGSNDPDTMYIRNDKLKAEYEIIREEGSYQIVVLGLEAEEEAEADDLRHSNRIPRFRQD